MLCETFISNITIFFAKLESRYFHYDKKLKVFKIFATINNKRTRFKSVFEVDMYAKNFGC